MMTYELIWWELVCKSSTVNKYDGIKGDFDFFTKSTCTLWLDYSNRTLCDMVEPKTLTETQKEIVNSTEPNTPLVDWICDF